MSKNAGDEELEELNKTSAPEVPWVETLEGSQGRGIGARVWRVRRDLGRSEGGD